MRASLKKIQGSVLATAVALGSLIATAPTASAVGKGALAFSAPMCAASDNQTIDCHDARRWIAQANTYNVENQWGGDDAPWNPGGEWVIGGRILQRVVALDISSDDNGLTLFGTMTYSGECPIRFRATRTAQNTYNVENRWRGDIGPWYPGGQWIIGARADQNVVAVDIRFSDGGRTLNGTMFYQNEGVIGLRAALA